MVQFISDLLDDLNIDLDQTHVALMTYSDSVDIAFFLTDRTDGRADVREGIEQVRTTSVTSITTNIISLSISSNVLRILITSYILSFKNLTNDSVLPW